MKLTKTEIKALRSILNKVEKAELVPVAEPVAEPAPVEAPKKARKVAVALPSEGPSKAEKKAQNKALYASINGHLGEATKCAGVGDSAGCVTALKKAMSLVPTHLNKSGELAWSGTVAQIMRKAESLGLSESSLA